MLGLEALVGEAHPTKYYLSSLPQDTSLKKMVRLARLRWRVERDCQERKSEVGLDHFEGRSWRGFHHHATLCMVAHGFLALHWVRFPPAGRSAGRCPRCGGSSNSCCCAASANVPCA